MIGHGYQTIGVRTTELIVGASIVTGAAVHGAVVKILERPVGAESRPLQRVGSQRPTRPGRSIGGNQPAGGILIITGIKNMDVNGQIVAGPRRGIKDDRFALIVRLLTGKDGIRTHDIAAAQDQMTLFRPRNRCPS